MPSSVVKRIQGRPIRGEGDVGRDKLIEAARTLLRARISPEISRKAIADAAGVTPALVSYYFPDKGDLVVAAMLPFLDDRISRLRAILARDEGFPARLRAVVTLFVGLNEGEAHLIDHAIDIFGRDTADPACRSALLDAYRQLREFYLAGARAKAWRALDPDFFLFALWGLCKFVAQTQGGAATSKLSVTSDRRVERIIDFVHNGLRAG